MQFGPLYTFLVNKWCFDELYYDLSSSSRCLFVARRVAEFDNVVSTASSMAWHC